MLPIRPSEIPVAKLSASFPEAVIQIWNQAIADAYAEGYALIENTDIIATLAWDQNIAEQDVPAAWLDVRELYTAANWDVEVYAGRTEFRRAKR